MMGNRAMHTQGALHVATLPRWHSNQDAAGALVKSFDHPSSLA